MLPRQLMLEGKETLFATPRSPRGFSAPVQLGHYLLKFFAIGMACAFTGIETNMATTHPVQHCTSGTSLTKAIRQSCCTIQMRQTNAVWSIKATGSGCLT